MSAAMVVPPAAPAPAPAAAATSRAAAAWAVLAGVPDPEVPAVSVCDLGIVRGVEDDGAVLRVVLTPTYSGCPATEVIQASVQDALVEAGLGPVHIQQRLAPAWTTDWISEAGRHKLRAYGIAPPSGMSSEAACGMTVTVEAARADGAGVGPRQTGITSPVRILPRHVACPRCGSTSTERLSAFGSTACKALHRCLDCREPFEHFKPI